MVNDYKAESLEHGVPPLKKRLATFCCAAEQIGKERLVWGFDPLILGERLRVTDLLKKFRPIGTV